MKPVNLLLYSFSLILFNMLGTINLGHPHLHLGVLIKILVRIKFLSEIMSGFFYAQKYFIANRLAKGHNLKMLLIVFHLPGS